MRIHRTASLFKNFLNFSPSLYEIFCPQGLNYNIAMCEVNAASFKIEVPTQCWVVNICKVPKSNMPWEGPKRAVPQLNHTCMHTGSSNGYHVGAIFGILQVGWARLGYCSFCSSHVYGRLETTSSIYYPSYANKPPFSKPED